MNNIDGRFVSFYFVFVLFLFTNGFLLLEILRSLCLLSCFYGNIVVVLVWFIATESTRQKYEEVTRHDGDARSVAEREREGGRGRE